MKALAASILLLASCSDYDLLRAKGGRGAGDTGTTLDACDDAGLGPVSIHGDDTCEIPPQAGQFVPEVQWSMQSFSESRSARDVMMTPVVGQLTDDDGDGTIGSAGDIPDIAFVSYDPGNWGTGVLRVVSGDGSKVHWSDARTGVQGQAGVAIGDIDADGLPDLVSVTGSGKVVAWEHDGTRKWISATFSTSGDADFNAYCSTPAISDMDGDGFPEVIVGRVILDGRTGATLGRGSAGIGANDSGIGTTSFAVDIDRDGVQEVITGNAFYTREGRLKNMSGDGDGYVAVADFDGDPEGELVVVRSDGVSLYQHTFERIWTAYLAPGQYGPPTVADFDGDGQPEIGVAGISSYTVIDTDGARLWTRTTQDGTSGVTGSAVYDFEGDGVAEVVYADEIRLWVFSGPDGSVKLESKAHTSNTWLEYPVIADVDGDGHAEIVVANNPYQGQSTAYHGITVIGDSADTWSLTRPTWNQHAYHITNVEDDGSIPANAAINWDTYDNFRSNDLHAGEGSLVPDLVPEVVGVCEERCDEDIVWVWARARNEGAAEVPAGVTLEMLHEGQVVADTTIPDPIPAGQASATVRFEVGRASVKGGFGLSVDSGDAVWECDEGNNQASWDEGVCQGTAP